MRTVKRKIVGAFIFTRDGRMLLGKNRKGGVYEGSWMIPGGGVDVGETEMEALIRETFEETGIDITGQKIEKMQIDFSGESEKTIRDTGERVLVKMDFRNYRVDLDAESTYLRLVAEDDFASPQWVEVGEIGAYNLSSPTRKTLKFLGVLK